MAAAIPFIRSWYADNNGKPLAGGKLWTYQAGTSTPKASFTSSLGTTPNTNPVILDSAGRASIYLEPGSYKLVLMDKNDNVIWTEDNVKPADGGGGGIVDSDYVFDVHSTRFDQQFGPTTGLMDTLVEILQGLPGVTKFKGRTGNVTPQSGDYDAVKIIFVATSEILSTDVQSAIEEVQANVMNVGDAVDDIISVPIGGTTGQILGKTSNLDGAIAWQNPPVTSPLTTKGDIYGHDGSVGVRIPVGTNGQLLTADSSLPAGVAFKDAPVSLPSQTGNAGKILETDGTNASWGDKPKTVVSATQTIANGGVITRTGGRVERVKVQASAGTRAAVTIGNTPAPLDGDQLFIQGMSNTAPIVVGPFEDLVAGQIGHLMYDLATTTWVKVGGV